VCLDHFNLIYPFVGPSATVLVSPLFYDIPRDNTLKDVESFTLKLIEALLPRTPPWNSTTASEQSTLHSSAHKS
jgi:hypothetical protein